jgi:hypothetical protein
MRKASWAVAAVLVVALAATAAVCAQARTTQGAAQVAALGPVQVAQAPGEGMRQGFGQMSEAERAKMREQMMERRLEEAGLTDKEKAAAKKTAKAKMQARDALQAQLMRLQRAANKSKPTNKQLQDALSAYRAAIAQYRSKVAAEDAALVKVLSLKSQVRCMSLGILDNGLPGGGRMGGGMRGPGGAGGGRPRGQ